MDKRKKKGFLGVEMSVLLVIALSFAGLLLFNYRHEIGSIMNDIGSEILSKEDVSGKQVINNPTNVTGVNNSGVVTFSPDFNNQTVIINKLYFENSENCKLAINNAYRCTLEVGETIYVNPKYAPTNATKNSLQWKQLNGKDIAAMVQSFDTQSMEVYGKKAGSTSVQAKTIDGSTLAVTAFIDVIQRATQVTLSQTAGTLSLANPSNTIVLNATVLPEDTTNKQVTWGFVKGDTGPQECVMLSSEGQQLTISLRSTCTLATVGTVKITATTENGVTPMQPFTLTIKKN